MSESHSITPPPPGKIEVKLGEHHVDITELGNILTAAGESITACFDTSDSTDTYRRRAETAEAKLEQLADLVAFHGIRSHFTGRDVVILDWAHLTKIMNGGTR